MGNQPSIKKVNFEDIQNLLQNRQNTILINTLTHEDQECIIPKTQDYKKEEDVINMCLNKDKNTIIIIYGKNSHDMKVYEKYNQLIDLGFTNVYIYPGGMFEWMLLQDIYSYEHFPTTTHEVDILKFKPKSGMCTDDSF